MNSVPMAYRVFRWTTVALAALLAWVTWKVYPANSAYFASVVWFFAVGLLAELFVNGQDNENRTEITPSAPIYWAAACICGAAQAIVI